MKQNQGMLCFHKQQFNTTPKKAESEHKLSAMSHAEVNYNNIKGGGGRVKYAIMLNS